MRRLHETVDDVCVRTLRGQTAYERWFGEQLQTRLTLLAASDGDGPLLSIAMPVCDPEPRWLDRALRSVIDQTYPNWELCVVDDASTDEAVRSLLDDTARRESRIAVARHETRGGISATSNRALSMARGEYVAFLDHDDELAPDALAWIARRAAKQAFDLLYTDEDKIMRSGRLRDPAFKPDPSSELLRSCMYFGHLCVYRRQFVNELGGFDPAFDGSQDWELAMRADARTDRIVHLPAVLYHWRMAHGSTADPASDAKPWAYEAGRRAVEADLSRRGERASVAAGIGRGHARIQRTPRSCRRVSVLYCECCGPMTSSDAGEHEAHRGRGGVPAHDDPEDRLEIEWIAMSPPNTDPPTPIGARWNAAAAGATGEVLIFLDGVRPARRSNWVTALAATVEREAVGAAGARIVDRRGRLVHAGVVVGGPERVRTDTGGLRRDEPGPLGLAQSLREVSAVTGGCLALRREVLDRLGGFDEGFSDALHDVDLCLAARSAGLDILYEPFVACTPSEAHAPGALEGLPWRRPNATNLERLMERWGEPLSKRDPFSNPGYHDRGAIFVPCYRPPIRARS